MTAVGLPTNQHRHVGAHVHLGALLALRSTLTAHIEQHAEDAAMWISPDSTGWALLTLDQRVALTREHLDHIDRLNACRDRIDRLLAGPRALPDTTTRSVP